MNVLLDISPLNFIFDPQFFVALPSVFPMEFAQNSNNIGSMHAAELRSGYARYFYLALKEEYKEHRECLEKALVCSGSCDDSDSEEDKEHDRALTALERLPSLEDLVTKSEHAGLLETMIKKVTKVLNAEPYQLLLHGFHAVEPTDVEHVEGSISNTVVISPNKTDDSLGASEAANALVRFSKQPTHFSPHLSNFNLKVFHLFLLHALHVGWSRALW